MLNLGIVIKTYYKSYYYTTRKCQRAHLFRVIAISFETRECNDVPGKFGVEVGTRFFAIHISPGDLTQSIRAAGQRVPLITYGKKRIWCRS